MLDENGNEVVDPAAEMLNEGGHPAPPVDYQKMFESMQAQNTQLMQQNQQLAVTVQQVAQRPVVQAPVQQSAVDPFAAFNPETAAALKGALDLQAKSFQQQLANTQQQFAGMQLETEAASISVIPGLTPDQVKRAQDIFRGNRSKGIPINASECVDVVLGADFRAGKVMLGSRGAPATMTGGSRAPSANTRQSTGVNNLSRKEQIAHYESMEGFDDARIVGIVDNED